MGLHASGTMFFFRTSSPLHQLLSYHQISLNESHVGFIINLTTLTMDSFHDSNYCSVKMYIYEAVYRLINASLSGWYLDIDIKIVFTDLAA